MPSSSPGSVPVSCFVVMAGLPGTGKSFLSQALAAELDAVILNKDVLRSALFSGHWLEYSREQDDFCVELLLQAAGYLARKEPPPAYLFIEGRPFDLSYQIDRVMSYAAELKCQAKIIHLTCSDDTARRRLSHDRAYKRNPDFELYLKMKKTFEPILYPKLTLNTDQKLRGGLLQQCLQYLKET